MPVRVGGLSKDPERWDCDDADICKELGCDPGEVGVTGRPISYEVRYNAGKRLGLDVTVLERGIGLPATASRDLAVEIAAAAFVELHGFIDANGKPLVPTRDNLHALINDYGDNFLAAAIEHFQELFEKRRAERIEAEGKSTGPQHGSSGESTASSGPSSEA